jgi:uncharacterized protein with von Willebrand factor type A (vWA) domain
VNREELLEMLDLAGKEALLPEAGFEIAVSEGDRLEDRKPASPTALHLDDWALRRGRDLLEESERLRELHLDEHAVADFHGCAFEPDPQLGTDCVNPTRRDFIRMLLETTDYRALHESTLLNATASTLAALAFAEQFAALEREAKEEIDPIEAEMSTLRAVGKALSRASEEVEGMRETAAALGFGPGSPGVNDTGAIAALFRRVRADPALRRICTLAGRFRRVAQSRQRRKASHGYDDVVGVTLDGEVSRLLPVEMTKLVVEGLEWDTLRRLVERQALCRLHESVEPVARGPILVTVDESGSMQGRKVETAKALALALAWIARRQRRWCGLVAFSGDSGERLLALPPGRWDEDALADWLGQFIGCGSSLDVPLRELPDYYRRLRCPPGVTDVLMITDALCRIPPDLRDDFNAWKVQVKARVVSLVIQSDPGDLTSVSDEVHLVEALSAEDEAVGHILSL